METAAKQEEKNVEGGKERITHKINSKQNSKVHKGF